MKSPFSFTGRTNPPIRCMACGRLISSQLNLHVQRQHRVLVASKDQLRVFFPGVAS